MYQGFKYFYDYDQVSKYFDDLVSKYCRLLPHQKTFLFVYIADSEIFQKQFKWRWDNSFHFDSLLLNF